MNGDPTKRPGDKPAPPPRPPRRVKGRARLWLQALLERFSIYPAKD